MKHTPHIALMIVLTTLFFGVYAFAETAQERADAARAALSDVQFAPKLIDVLWSAGAGVAKLFSLSPLLFMFIFIVVFILDLVLKNSFKMGKYIPDWTVYIIAFFMAAFIMQILLSLNGAGIISIFDNAQVNVQNVLNAPNQLPVNSLDSNAILDVNGVA